MFNPSRNEARDFLFAAWRKFSAQEVLTPLETIAVEIISKHPEYHALLGRRDSFVDRDYAPEQGETNPFLHMAMHLAVHEQVAIDQPRGARDAHRALTEKLQSLHDAEHEMMDCLAEMIWQAQRQNAAPDAALYLACLAMKRVPGQIA